VNIIFKNHMLVVKCINFEKYKRSHLYGFKNLKFILKFSVFFILFRLFVIRILGVHANLSKCWRGTLSEKVWESLIYKFLRISLVNWYWIITALRILNLIFRA